MRRVILDTNVCIYLADGTINKEVISNVDVIFASVTKIEALGYGKITTQQESYLTQLFLMFEQYELSNSVISKAIQLRVQKRMGLGDAIIAATALDAQCELWTANYKDFEHIYGLQLHNPLT